MGLVVMRNVRTGEHRQVEAEGEEFLVMKEEIYDHGGAPKPLWEQQGEATARRVLTDAEEGALQEEDLGYDHKPLAAVAADVSEVGPDPAPHTALTPAEVEAGLTPEKKREELDDQLEVASAEDREEQLSDGAEAIAESEGIARAPEGPEGAEESSKEKGEAGTRKSGGGRGQKARAGGDPPREKERNEPGGGE